MNRRLTFVLAAANLALAAILAWQWLSPAGQRRTHWVAPAPILPQLGTGSSLATGSADAARMAAILERPVFAVTRRPPPPPNAATSVAAAPPPPPDPLNGLHVYGMFSGAEGGGLIVKADGKSRRLKVAESIGGWRLKEIRGTDAVFVQGKEIRVVSLTQAKPGNANLSAPMRPPAPVPMQAPAPVAPPSATAPPPAAPTASPAARRPAGASSPFVIGGSR